MLWSVQGGKNSPSKSDSTFSFNFETQNYHDQKVTCETHSNVKSLFKGETLP